MPALVVDRKGQPVTVGTGVRVLEIAAFLKRDLPAEAAHELATMVGEVFEIYEIDEHGAAWVEKVWNDPDGARSRSLALESHEMQVCECGLPDYPGRASNAG
jgi:hypothetical protein